MQIKKITPFTRTRRPETEIEQTFTALNKYKQDKQARIFTGAVKVSDLEEREGVLQVDGTNVYRVYRYNDKLYRQQLTEVLG